MRTFILHNNATHYFNGMINITEKTLKDNIPHNTCQIYIKTRSKNTQMTLESQIFDEKALR